MLSVSRPPDVVVESVDGNRRAGLGVSGEGLDLTPNLTPKSNPVNVRLTVPDGIANVRCWSDMGVTDMG